MKLINKPQRGQIVTLMTVLSVLILAVTGGYWYRDIYSTPERVFARMLESSLTTKSVTKHTTEAAAGQSVSQTTRLTVAGDPQVHGISKIVQGSGEQTSAVERETLTTLDKAYLRLISIDTNQLSASGEPFDFSAVLNVWSQNDATESDNANAQLYGQNVAVPYADLSSEDRKEVTSVIWEMGVYEVDYSKATRTTFQDRASYKYSVGVKPSAFIAMMKSIGSKVGLAGYDDVNPEEYADLPAVPFTFTVDILTGDLMLVESGADKQEFFSSHGYRPTFQPPTDAISMQELQERLNKLQ